MTNLAALSLAPDPRPSSAVVRRIEDLAVFFKPHVDVAVLAREPSPSLTRYAATLARSWDLGFASRVGPDGEGLDALCLALPDGDGQGELVDDVRLLVELLSDITGAERVGVRLARLIAPMCPRFHVDPVFVRLVATYAGPGAEWIDEPDVDRRFLGHAAQGKRDEESGLMRPGAAVCRMQPGDVGLLKGKGFPGNERRGAVHRSPPGTSEDTPRLLLTLDPLD
jgi:hypothetical protein